MISGLAADINVDTNSTQTIANVPAGSYTLVITDVAVNCLPNAWETPITALEGQTTRVTLNLTCEQAHRLAFASNRNGNLDIFSIKMNGADLRQLTSDQADELWPVWGPTGRISFTMFETFGREAWTMNVDGTAKQRVTTDQQILGGAEWSPTGDWLAFRAGAVTAVTIVRPDGSDLRVLDSFAPISSGERLTWSPDGVRLAYAKPVDCQPPICGQEVFIVDIAGSEPVRITGTISNNFAPHWSPDGGRIAFAAGVRTIRIDGTDLLVLTRGSNARWSPDGNWLSFYDAGESSDRIGVIQPDGANETHLAVASPSDVDWSADSRFIVFLSDGNIHGTRRDGQNSQLVTEGRTPTFER